MYFIYVYQERIWFQTGCYGEVDLVQNLNHKGYHNFYHNFGDNCALSVQWKLSGGGTWHYPWVEAIQDLFQCLNHKSSHNFHHKFDHNWALGAPGKLSGGGVLGTIPGCSSVYYSFFFREFTWHNRFRSVTSKVFVMWTMHYLHLILKKQMKLACFTRICIWLLLEFSLCQTHSSTNPPPPGS